MKAEKKITGFVRTREMKNTLIPHSFTSIVDTSIKKPKILISPTALDKMKAYIELSSIEISWLGLVFKQGSNFLIKDVFLVEQENSVTTTEMSENGLATLGEKLLGQSNGMDLYNALRFWGHSHVYMGTEPSGQDNDQLNDFMHNLTSPDSFFLRGIGNKQGRLQFTIFLHGGLITIKDVPWEMYRENNDVLTEEIRLEIQEKVTEVSFPIYKNGFYYNGTYYKDTAKENKKNKSFNKSV